MGDSAAPQERTSNLRSSSHLLTGLKFLYQEMNSSKGVRFKVLILLLAGNL